MGIVIPGNSTTQTQCIKALQHSQSATSADPKLKDNMTENETGGQSQQISREQMKTSFPALKPHS